MASVIPNIAKGRVNEYVRRVRAGDPANSRLLIVLLQANEAIAVLNDYDDLGTLLAAAGNTEVSVASYSRLTLAAGVLVDPTVDDTANTQSFDPGDFDFPALEAGQSVTAAVVCYIPDGVGPGADSTAVPIHVTVPATPVALNGEVLHFRTPSGLWSAA